MGHPCYASQTIYIYTYKEKSTKVVREIGLEKNGQPVRNVQFNNICFVWAKNERIDFKMSGNFCEQIRWAKRRLLMGLSKLDDWHYWLMDLFGLWEDLESEFWILLSHRLACTDPVFYIRWSSSYCSDAKQIKIGENLHPCKFVNCYFLFLILKISC
jgi:hypothetical protein